MNLLVSLTVIRTRECLPTFWARKRTLSIVGSNVTFQMERSGESLRADVAHMFRCSRNCLWCCKSLPRIVRTGMEEALVLFQFFRRPKSEVLDGAVREGASERAVVSVDVEVTAFGVLEAFVEVVAGHLRTFISFVAVERSEVLLFMHEFFGRSEVFK
jgi:hypothetical protein